MKKLILASAILLASGSALYAKEKEAGLGFEYGTSIQIMKDSHFKSGGSNFFRLNMKADEKLTYFVHNETGTITASDAGNTSTINQQITGLGAKLSLDNNLSFSLLFGNNTISSNASGTIGAINTNAQVADIGVNWEKVHKRVTFQSGLSYRNMTISDNIVIGEEQINDLTSYNLNLSIKYSF